MNKFFIKKKLYIKIMTTKVKISNLEENNNTLKFTISNINVSYVNAIRRIIISDIPCIVIRSEPHEENNINIFSNKTRINNELIKQRISCIPIHINDIENFPYDDYIVILNKINNTNTIIYATSEDFEIKNIKLEKFLSKTEVSQIFPPDPITGHYIDIVRLLPSLNSSSDLEEIKLEAKLVISNAKENNMFNVASTVSYGNSLDLAKIKEEWDIKEKTLRDNYSKEDIDFIKKDWMLLDAKRIYIEDSFDFILETIGIYSNYKLLELAINIIIKKLYIFLDTIKENSDLISQINDTMENTYIITLENEDYTIGKIIEYYLYITYFKEKKELNFVSFFKKHPHDKNSIIKISFKEIIQKDDIILLMEETVNANLILLNEIKNFFKT